MSFWNNHNAQPIRSFDFKVEFSGEPKSWTVKSCTMPSAEVQVNEYQLGNHTYKYPGGHKWNDVTITFVDDKSTTRRLLQLFHKQGWVNPHGISGDSRRTNTLQTAISLRS